MKTPWIALLTFVAAGLACVARLPIDGSKCPCPMPGYCCVAGACVPGDGICDVTPAQDSGTGKDTNMSPSESDGPCGPPGTPCEAGRQPGEACIVGSPSHGCVAGSVCLLESCGDFCHKLCTSDDQCEGGTCDLPVKGGGAERACRAGPRTCDPIVNAGCLRPLEACFVEGASTYCDCTALAQPENSACLSSNNCFPGLSCVPVTDPTDLRCRRVCALGRPTCLPGTTCVPVAGNAMYGTCQ